MLNHQLHEVGLEALKATPKLSRAEAVGLGRRV